jgi:N-acetylmuramoyl-L-alanine amidase
LATQKIAGAHCVVRRDPLPEEISARDNKRTTLNIRSSQRRMRWGALLLLAALPGVPAYARARHTESWARDRFAAAERMREALNGRPQTDRTRRDFQRVINAYRDVYYGAPTSTKADPSVVAVAETLVEMGRRFNDDKILNEAIGQYKFLRREYPGSKYRCDALFTIGEIYKDDLNSPEQARSTFQEFLDRYPHNRLVEDAQQAIAELDRQAAAAKKADKQETADKSKGAKDIPQKNSGDKAADKTAKDSQVAASSEDHAADPHPSRLPRVTGIRHWSTPDYTRVAIDLESEVKFGSQRISNPDRIFFDLRDTKLASTLVGKSFDVDDGFLKKIRVAQFQPGRTRVVLEVDSLSAYDAFLLPNPYRLIIDIHGKDAKAARARMTKDPATADVEAAPKAGTDASADPDDAPPSMAKSPANNEEEIAGARLVAAANLKPVLQPRADATVPSKSIVKKVVVPADDDDDDVADVPPAKVAKHDIVVKHAGRTTTGSSAVTSKRAAADSDDGADAPKDTPREAQKDAKETAKTAANRSVKKDASDDASGDPDSHDGARPDLHEGVREARPTASGDRSLIRALGLKIGKIVIDPGHGGHDTGTIGPNGLEEKDLVLEVGRRLGKLLEARLGAEVVYTRKNDTFIPLETRTAIANQQRADLFISIHANSSDDPGARGVETYYLNFTSSPDALDVAARENAVSEKSIYELQDLVKKIAMKEKIEESREFAGDVQESLHSGLAAKSPAIRDRGVKKAPFIVLIGANMPSILAEISFVSNPTDEHRLETSEYRQRIAESLYRGIAKYVNGLSGVKLASKMDKGHGE